MTAAIAKLLCLTALFGMASVLPATARPAATQPTSASGPVQPAPELTVDAAPSAPVSAPQAAAANDSIPFRSGIHYHTAGPGTDAFVSLDGFVPLGQAPGKTLTFLQGRLAIFTDSSALGGGILLGHRVYDASRNRVYGGYLAYDIRNTGESLFNQIGLGFESLGETLEFRVNGYFPAGSTRRQVGESLSGNAFFQQNVLRLERLQQFETAMSGFDAEVGTRLLGQGQGSLRGYAGLYYLNAQGDRSTFGIKGRLEAHPNDLLNLSLAVTHDDLFDTRVIFAVGINLPGQRQSPRQIANLGAWVERQAGIAVDQRTIADSIIARNPATNQPYLFRHVVLGINSGTGTIEAPYGTVAAAVQGVQPNDIIYVQLGTNAPIPAVVLPSQVTLLSTGPVQFLDTSLGRVVLPLSGTGILPRIADSTALSLVTLGNDNRVSGFALDSAVQNGIFGRNISNSTLENNRIVNAARAGILLENVGGTVTVSNTTIANAGIGAVLLENQQGQVNLALRNNQLSNNPLGVNVGLSNTAQAVAQITGNAIAQGNLGLNFQLRNSAQLNATVSGNEIRQTRFDGILLRAIDNSQATLALTGNTLQDIQDSAINLELRNAAVVNAAIADTTIRNTVGQGVFYEAFNTSRGVVSVTNTTMQNIGDSAIDLDLSDQAQVTASLRNNTLSDTRFDSIFVKTSQAAQATVAIANNQIRNSQDNGITANALDFSRMDLTISGNRIDNTVFDSVLLEVTQDAQARFAIANNAIFSRRAGVAGFNLNARDRSQVNATVQSNTIIDSATFGSTIQSAGTSSLCLGLRANQSDRSFNLSQTGLSTFRAEDTLPSNQAVVNQVGAITTVLPGSCP